MSELLTLAKKWGTDKALHYATLYDELLRDRREYVRKVLEFGIGDPSTMCSSVARMGQKSYVTGASLYMWEAYFPNAAIYGLDYNREILFNRGRIQTFYCDQGDPESYAEVGEIIGSDFDLIIDDGSHIPAHQMLCFEKMFPLVKSGGLYIIEDCSMSKPLDIPVPHETRDFWHNPLDPARVVVIRK